MPTNTVISYPIPAYQNLPIESQFYLPGQFFISAIATGPTTTITTTVDNNYVIGQEVRLIIPEKFGSRQLNGSTGLVLSIPAPNQVVLNINSNGADPFIASPVFIPFESKTLAQILAIGDANSGAINAQGRRNTGNFIPGSFINISPL